MRSRTIQVRGEKPRKRLKPLAEGLAGKRKRRRYTPDEVRLIEKRYNELLGKGLNYEQIGEKIGKEIERSAGSVVNKIKQLRKAGEIGENPSKGKEKFSEEEIEFIKRRYAELVEKGLDDSEIGRRISKEMGRTINSVKRKIRHLRETEEIGKNPNKGVNYIREEEVELVKRRYAELVRKGLNNKEIAKKIAKELGRSLASIKYKLFKMRRNGELEENDNAQKFKKFSEEELELIKRRYAELVEEGLGNRQIAKKIGGELGRSMGTVREKIRQIRKAGEFADAEALREKQDILGVVKALEEFGEEE